MEFLNKEFTLTDEMIDVEEITDNGDSYFIPLKLDKIPKDAMKDPYCSDLISEIYIFALCDLSNILLVSRDIYGQSCVEKWKQKEGEVDIVQEIIQGLE